MTAEPAQIRTAAAGPGPAGSDDTAALLRILQLEADIRRIPSERELIYHLANESRSVLGFRQAFVLRRRRRWQLEAVSSVASFDAHAPLNRQVVRYVAQLSAKDGSDTPRSVNLETATDLGAVQGHTFRHALWMPLASARGKPFAGVLLLHEKPWPDSFVPLAERIRDAYAYAWRALAGGRLERRSWVSGRLIGTGALLALGLAGFIRAPLTVLAPVEVTGQDRFAVAAPIDGAIDEVLVAPNTPVTAGAVLARIEDTELRNALEIAERHVIVAQARLGQLQTASFADRAAARELKVAEAELTLAEAESALARERLTRIQITAPRPGIVIFDDPRDLTGRPVSVGERIMEITDPGKLEFTIRMPVADSIILQDGARVRVFLDSDPLQPLDAKLLRSSYHATTQDDGSFGYTLVARAEGALDGTRIGARGTAQVFGDRHSLYFHVFRRPLSWLRQTFGA